MRGRGYQNAVLTVIAVLLGLGIADRQWNIAGPAEAQAQSGVQDTGGLSNAIEQRKQMISELRQLSIRIDRMESRISGGINVKVTEMPPIQFPREGQGGQ